MSQIETYALEPEPNPVVVKEHLDLVTQDWLKLGTDFLIEVRCLTNGSTAYESFPAGKTAQAADYATEKNLEGFNCYVVVNPILAESFNGSAANDNSIAGACFCFADADAEQASKNLRGVSPKPDFLVVTGTVPFERLHAYWRLEDPCIDLVAWTRLQKSIATNLGTDKAVTNPSRIMRIAGTVSWPNEQKTKRGYEPELVNLELIRGGNE